MLVLKKDISKNSSLSLGDAKPFELIKWLILALIKVFANEFKSFLENSINTLVFLDRNLEVRQAISIGKLFCFILADLSNGFICLVS